MAPRSADPGQARSLTLMGRSVDVAAGEVVVRLSGLTAVGAVKRTLRIPLSQIRSVSTERYERTGLRLGGASIPFTDIREGRFRSRGARSFLSFEDRDRVITLGLDRSAPGVGYDLVVLGVDDPEAVVTEIEARRPA